MKRSLVIVLLLAASLWAGDVPSRPAPVRDRNPSPPAVVKARTALFRDSDLPQARQAAAQALRDNPADVEALFIEMEAAALEADTGAALKAGLRLCELHSAARDPRAAIAAARLLDLAANSAEFRAALPRIQALLARRGEPHPQGAVLRAALIAAAMDGAPGLNLQELARASGVMTEWRLAGPFGRYGNLEFDQHWAAERDQLSLPYSDGHAVERFQVDDGLLALPAYFARGGVFYAAAEITAGAGLRQLRVESPGTLEVMVDGVAVLRKDDRFRRSPEIAWRTLRLSGGRHRVLVKFLASAAPFRVALAPASTAPVGRFRPRIDDPREAAYVAAAQKYWAGDYNGVISDLRAPGASAVADFLMYRAWTHVDDDSPETSARLKAALQSAPTALAAEYELARRAYTADRIDEALERLHRLLEARPDFAPGQQLLAEIAIGLNWPSLAENALEVPLRVHPSCDVLLKAYNFFLGHARYEQARRLQAELADCAPDTLAYVQTLSQAGEHAQAAAAAEAAVAARPLDRDARELLVREMALSGEAARAHAAARQLAALAPNSGRYRRLAQIAPGNIEAVLDDGSPRAADFVQPFYSRYRRDGVEMVRRTQNRKFSGGPAVVLVNDRVAKLWEDGRVSLYVHKVTRVLDRDGIEKYGEVDLPRGAEILELRTLKSDGSVAEPEFTPQKKTVSMPALAAGDAIDEEYVVHYDDAGGAAEHAQAFQQTFGSFAAPILYSRFVTLTPADDSGLEPETAAGIAAPDTALAGGLRVRTWEKDDIPQSAEEAATARGDVLPAARLHLVFPGGWNDVRDRFRNELVEALRAGPRVEQMAARLRSREPEARAREIFRLIANSVRSAGTFDPEEMIPAEETLSASSGSRTIALLAVARAAGLDADLVLGRESGEIVQDARASLGLYTRPLVRFRFPGGNEIFADAETEGLAFGAVPPKIERHDALLVPVLRENEPVQDAALIVLPPNAEEQSVARGEVALQEDGTLIAEVSIRMGAWRSAQMRGILAGIEPAQRPRFFQQLAARIFAGAQDVTGAATNEHDPDRPLLLTLHCRAPRYLDLAQGSAELDQLVPALGLKKMYSAGSRRNFPLFIDTPLVESADFRLHLPPGLTVVGGAPGLRASSAFGSYSFSVRQSSAGVLDISRSFRIPVQVIAPERFPEFSAFAARIDQAERQRITLERN